jgi:hypothetical protein
MIPTASPSPTNHARRGARIMQKRIASPKGRELPSKDPEAGLLNCSVLVIISDVSSPA